MARMSRAERQQEHRREVEGHKQRLREEMRGGGHFYFAEWYRHHRKAGDAAIVDAMEEMWDELARHDREHPAPRNFGMDDGLERARDLESRRREARDLERAAGIAESARKKASGVGGGLYATTEPEPEEEYDEPDPAQEDYEQQRRTLASHGILSRTPAPPQQTNRKKKRRGYVYPPFNS